MSQSGAGAEVTALAESLQAYACATRQFLGKDLVDVEQITSLTTKSANCDRTLKQCLDSLNDNWFHSVVVTANKIASEYSMVSKNYIFYRGGSVPTEVYDEFGKFRKTSGISGNDKWNPADIWMVDRNFSFKGNWPTLLDYNNYMREQFLKKKLIGISLKLVPKGSVSSQIYNSDEAIVANFTGIKIGANMSDSKDIYITYKSKNKEGQIQFRNFSSIPVTSSWQAEIKGKTAAGGKIGGGIVIRSAVESGITQSKLTVPSTFQSQIEKPTEFTIKKFATMFKHLSGSNKSINQLIEETKENIKKDKTWWMSKYLGVDFIYTIMKENKEDEVTKWLFAYGSSSTDNSSIFVKYS